MRSRTTDCVCSGTAGICCAGSDAPCCMIDVSIFGGQAKKNYDKMTTAVTELIAEECAIPAERIYVKYTEYDKWGWNGSNF